MKRLIPLAVIAGLASPPRAAARPRALRSSTTASGASTTSARLRAVPAVPPTCNIGNPSSPVTLNEAGSSLLYPFLQELVDPAASPVPEHHPGPGRRRFRQGHRRRRSPAPSRWAAPTPISAPSEIAANPGLINIPIVVSSQAVNYNLPGITNLQAERKRPGPDLPGQDHQVERFGHRRAQPGRHPADAPRSSRSGGWTPRVTRSSSPASCPPPTPTWSNGPGFGTTVTWPSVSDEVTASGNPGMVQTCKATPGLRRLRRHQRREHRPLAAGLGEALLQNQVR